MLLLALIAVPLLAALVAFVTPSEKAAPLIVAGTAVLHLVGYDHGAEMEARESIHA